MRHFEIYRKLILILGVIISVVSAAMLFIGNSTVIIFLLIFSFVILCGFLFLLDFLHNRYNDDLLENITLLIETLVEQQEQYISKIFADIEQTDSHQQGGTDE